MTAILPRTNPGVLGAVWIDNGQLKVSVVEMHDAAQEAHDPSGRRGEWQRTPWWHPTHWMFQLVWRRDKAKGNIHDSPWWEYRTDIQLAHEFLKEKFDTPVIGPSPFTEELLRRSMSQGDTL